MSLRTVSFLCFLICINFAITATAQTNTIDSLRRLLSNVKEDTSKIILRYKLAEEIKGSNDEADRYLEEGYRLAKVTGNQFYIARYYLTKGNIFFDRTKYDTARLIYDSAINFYNGLINSGSSSAKQVEEYKYDRADCFTGKGLSFAKQYRYHESIQCYLETIAGIENISGSGKNESLATVYADIASNYYELEEFEDALKYDKQGLVYVDRNGNTELYVVGHLFVADDFSALSQFDSSAAYLDIVRPVVVQEDKANLNVRFYYILGGIYRKKKEWEKALKNYQKANEAAKKLNDNFQVVNSEEGIATCYLNTGNFIKAKELALHVLAESIKMNVPFFRMQALQLLTEAEEKMGHIAKAYQYQKQYTAISDSVKKEKVQRQMDETEVKYQTEKKEKEILQLQKDKLSQSLSLKQQSTLNYFLIGSLATLMIIGFLGYRNFRHRQQLAKQQDELQQQKISELEKDKQLVAVDSMLQGQEEERSRLAKDLHDGLGGLLSGVKFSLSNMKDNLIITPENMSVFERSLDMLDTSIRELRRVAHNMMPEMLTKFGLNEALKEYCNTINTTNLLAIKYQAIGLDARIEKTAEIIIYRIIQELLNNIMKHASATEAIVQLVKEEGRLSIIVEDNGKGFDVAGIKEDKGSGLTSIQSRIDYLKGHLEIHSAPGKGVLINIELNL